MDLLKILREVFVVLKGNGLKLKQEKCPYSQNNICYLSYKISKYGLNPIPAKLDTILNARTSINVSKLKGLLGKLKK